MTEQEPAITDNQIQGPNQTPTATLTFRSRWQAEWIDKISEQEPAISGNQIQKLRGHLQEADGKRSGYVP